MELVFIRHGQPVRAEPGTDGIANPLLSGLGKMQAQRLVDELSDQLFVAIICSSSARAIETLRPLLEVQPVDARITPLLQEFHQAGNSYVPIDELRREGGDEWKRIARGELPAYVNGAAFRQRVVQVVEGLIAEYPGRKSVLVMCHAGVINAYLGHVLDIERGLAFPLHHASISRVLAARDGRRIVRSVNETQHVQDLLNAEEGEE